MIYKVSQKVSQKQKEKLELLDFIAIEYGFEVNELRDVTRIFETIAEKLGVTCFKLGKLSNIGSHTYSTWKRETAVPTPTKFKKLLDYYVSEVEKKKNESE